MEAMRFRADAEEATPSLSRCPLWQQAQVLSGITAERAAAVDEVNLYERLGEPALRRLSAQFYDRVYADTAPLPDGSLLRAAFANTTKADAAANQSDYLIERLGGPRLYSASKGRHALIARHAPYAGVTRDAARRWLTHMRAAMAASPELTADADASARLADFFQYTAFFITEGRALLNPHRLVGYGGALHDGGA